jgi:hypothetical protein
LFQSKICFLSLVISPRLCDFEVAEELQDAATEAAVAAAAAAGIKVLEKSTQWMRFGSIGGAGRAVDSKAVNRQDSVEVGFRNLLCLWGLR